MSLYITAQLVGFLGYLLLTGGSYLKDKDNVIKAEIFASFLLSLQWYMLSQPGFASINLLLIFISAGSLLGRKNDIIHKTLPIFYPIGLLVILLISNGTIVDILCLIGFCAEITSKRSKDLCSFRGYAIIAVLSYAISGFIALSIPALLFNTARLSIHAYRLNELMMLRPVRINSKILPFHNAS